MKFNKFDRIHFGKQLKTLRTSRGLSQAELGKQLDVGQTTISNWEKGLREPENIGEILNIAHYFKVPTSVLMNTQDQLKDISKFAARVYKTAREELNLTVEEIELRSDGYITRDTVEMMESTPNLVDDYKRGFYSQLIHISQGYDYLERTYNSWLNNIEDDLYASSFIDVNSAEYKDNLDLLIHDLVRAMQDDYIAHKNESAFFESFSKLLRKIPDTDKNEVRKKVLEYTEFLIINHKNNSDYKKTK